MATFKQSCHFMTYSDTKLPYFLMKRLQTTLLCHDILLPEHMVTHKVVYHLPLYGTWYIPYMSYGI